MTDLSLTLPWPDPVLSPNAPKRHWRSKSEARIKARETGQLLAYGKTLVNETMQVTVTFFPPDKRRRDLDNLLTSIKPTLDGICIGLGIDDSNFKRITLKWGDRVRGGNVELEIREWKRQC
jgi:crossover junction endodeoxyribonuclease RusA